MWEKQRPWVDAAERSAQVHNTDETEDENETHCRSPLPAETLWGSGSTLYSAAPGKICHTKQTHVQQCTADQFVWSLIPKGQGGCWRWGAIFHFSFLNQWLKTRKGKNKTSKIISPLPLIVKRVPILIQIWSQPLQAVHHSEDTGLLKNSGLLLWELFQLV